MPSQKTIAFSVKRTVRDKCTWSSIWAEATARVKAAKIATGVIFEGDSRGCLCFGALIVK
jgi:hypothetical protein